MDRQKPEELIAEIKRAAADSSREVLASEIAQAQEFPQMGSMVWDRDTKRYEAAPVIPVEIIDDKGGSVCLTPDGLFRYSAVEIVGQYGYQPALDYRSGLPASDDEVLLYASKACTKFRAKLEEWNISPK